ncbi:MAG: PQQ-binding-like beta-propeller repeat protein [Alphaproteobacteria bacterium]|nr:MAG: PQQ-binding-like beta-propeller repeat protein [Alphaproteobacteria bacterium]
MIRFCLVLIILFFYGCSNDKNINWKKTEVNNGEFVINSKLGSKIIADKTSIPFYKINNDELDQNMFDFGSLFPAHRQTKSSNLGSSNFRLPGIEKYISNCTEFSLPASVKDKINSKCVSVFVFSDAKTDKLIVGTETNEVFVFSKLTKPNNSNWKLVFHTTLNSNLNKAYLYKQRLILVSSLGYATAFSEKWELLWSYKNISVSGIGLVNSSSLDDEKLIILSSDGFVSIVDVVSGQERWSFSFGESVRDFEIYAKNRVVLVKSNEKLLVLENNGSVIFSDNIAGLKRAFMTSNGQVFLVIGEKILVTSVKVLLSGKFAFHKMESSRIDGTYFLSKNRLCFLTKQGKLYTYGDQQCLIHDFDESVLCYFRSYDDVNIFMTNSGMLVFPK